jgi:hypothetical protein
MVVAAGSADNPDSASVDGEGARSGGRLAPRRIFASSRPKLPRARLMMTVVNYSLVVTGPADTSRGASGTASYAAIHAESAGIEVSAALRSRSSTRRTAPVTSNLASLIPDCYELRCEGKVIGGLEADLWKIRAAVLQ